MKINYLEKVIQNKKKIQKKNKMIHYYQVLKVNKILINKMTKDLHLMIKLKILIKIHTL